MSHGQQQGLLIVTDDATNPIAQRLNGLKHAAFQGRLIRGQHGGHLQDQAELQFPHDTLREGRVALLGLEGIQRQEETLPTKVRRALGQAQRIGAT